MGRGVRHGQEVIFGVGGQIQNFAPCHHVIVHIHGVDGVGNQHGIVLAEQVQQVAQVAFGAVRNKNFRQIQRHAVVGVVIADRLAQEAVALLAGDVAVEGFFMCLLLDSVVHSPRHRGRQRQGDIADAQTDDVGVRVRLLVIGDLMGNGAEKIAFVQLCIMRIEMHDFPPTYLILYLIYHNLPFCAMGKRKFIRLPRR